MNETLDSDSLEKIDNLFDDNSREEKVEEYLKFYLHFGACCLVWFIYLPVLIFICSFLSELFRFRLILGFILFQIKLKFCFKFYFLGIRFFVNFISVVVLFYIMWSPKTPLKLPGKKKKKYEFSNLQYMYNNDGMDHDDGQLKIVKENNLINLT